jgi:hypothetical protein
LIKHDSETKKIASSLIENQIKLKTTLDNFFIYTNNIPSFIYSILLLLYSELIFLIFYSEENYKYISKDYIMKNMVFGNIISEEDFDLCYKLIFLNNYTINEFSLLKVPFYELNNRVLLAKWMFDKDFSVIDETKKIALNGRNNSKIGKVTNYFGKEVLEKIVKERFKDYQWQVIETDIKIKKNKKIVTDIDLVAFKEGTVIIGQIKLANSTVHPYHIWKSNQIIEKAKKQMMVTKEILNDNDNLLYSILKRGNIINCKTEIKNVHNLVISGNNFFNNYDNSLKGISVVGFEILDYYLCYITNFERPFSIKELFELKFTSVDFERLIYKTESVIDNSKYKFLYEELEIDW